MVADIISLHTAPNKITANFISEESLQQCITKKNLCVSVLVQMAVDVSFRNTNSPNSLNRT